MKKTAQTAEYNEFLAKHNAKIDKREGVHISPTHTRIGDKEQNIYGGSYIISQEDLTLFHKLYTFNVFEKKKLEYLTERQLETCGPILIDLDFRYNYDVEKRQHTKEQIQDLIMIYLEELKELFIFEENKPFPIYVMEKPDVNRLADGSLTKDGIHLIIGVQMDHIMQLMLREKILGKISEIWDLPLINEWESVLDEGISKGTTNWQMYGSRKPGNLAYELTQYYLIGYDKNDGEFMMEERKVDEIDIKTDLYKLSAQNNTHQKFEINPKIVADYEKRSTKKTKIKKNTSNTKLKLLITDDNEDEDDGTISMENIKTKEILKRVVDSMLNNLKTDEYHIKELHEYTQILPEKYYEPGSHLINRQVAFALKHTDERLFISWVMLRSKATDFDYNSISDLHNQWNKYKERANGITKRSIMYWAKQDAYDAYMAIKKTTIDYYIDQTIDSPTEYDFAMVLYQMFKDKYVCSSIINKSWYRYRNHHWERDFGYSLRLSISREMNNLYQEKGQAYAALIINIDDDQQKDHYKEKIRRIGEVSLKLKKTNDKSNIFREASEIFYDEEFVKKMDENRYLLCFSNGVVDLKNKIFREGYPQDYITKSTGIPYTDFDDSETENTLIVSQIKTFMEQLFPVASLNKYMWDHLASTLIGENINQTFNIYRGNGSNGKSLLTDLMNFTLGEYAGTVPVTLVTEKRVGVGSTSSEVMQLKGVRYAVMQEPSKDAKINEGMMKQLTGDSTMQARALYCEAEKFAIQFHLCVCTNTLFQIVSNDDGTWRRIRIVEFQSKFVNPEDPVIHDTLYQFPKDPILKEKLPIWAPVFASMLVKRAFETQGIVENCDMVMSASNKYRQGQDHIAAFVAESVIKKEGKKISKQELIQSFKIWFQDSQGTSKVPKGAELYEYMDKKFGTNKKEGWVGVEILKPETQDDVAAMY